MKNQRQRKVYFENKCCVCGGKNCGESTDHSYTDAGKLRQIIRKHMVGNTELDQLKEKVREFYQ